MNTILYIVQGLLSSLFIMTGITKATQPIMKLEKQFPWVTENSISMTRFIGIAEILAAVGLILPWITNIAPILTPLSAYGICIIMILAILTVHFEKREFKEIGINIIILLMAAFVAYGRS